MEGSGTDVPPVTGVVPAPQRKRLLTMQRSLESTVTPVSGLPLASKKLKTGPLVGNENGSRKSEIAEACPDSVGDGPADASAVVLSMKSAMALLPTKAGSRGVCVVMPETPAEKMPVALDAPGTVDAVAVPSTTPTYVRPTSALARLMPN